MRGTILPKAIILTEVRSVMVGITAKGSIVA